MTEDLPRRGDRIDFMGGLRMGEREQDGQVERGRGDRVQGMNPRRDRIEKHLNDGMKT